MAGLVIRQPRVVEYIVALPAGNGRSDLGSTYGARVIDSTPPATMIEASPTAIARAAPTTASRPEAHSRLTVEPGTDVGSPASSDDIRATLRLSSPDWLAAPKLTSPIRAGSRPGVRSSSALITTAPRSSGRTFANAPPSRPTGVRTASTTKTSRPCTLCLHDVDDPDRAAAVHRTHVAGRRRLLARDRAHWLVTALWPPRRHSMLAVEDPAISPAVSLEGGQRPACAPVSSSSEPARPGCCCPTCSTSRASSRCWSRTGRPPTCRAGSGLACWSPPRSTSHRGRAGGADRPGG